MIKTTVALIADGRTYLAPCEADGRHPEWNAEFSVGIHTLDLPDLTVVVCDAETEAALAQTTVRMDMGAMDRDAVAVERKWRNLEPCSRDLRVSLRGPRHAGREGGRVGAE